MTPPREPRNDVAYYASIDDLLADRPTAHFPTTSVPLVFERDELLDAIHRTLSAYQRRQRHLARGDTPLWQQYEAVIAVYRQMLAWLAGRSGDYIALKLGPPVEGTDPTGFGMELS